tara:strand:+ start:356 stop:538 length:183 start_codon:yes stop_codon:yes gene_type:complete
VERLALAVLVAEEQLHSHLLVLQFTEQQIQAVVVVGKVLHPLVLLLEQVALELLSLAKQQ